jgi:hypothetical protein
VNGSGAARGEPGKRATAVGLTIADYTRAVELDANFAAYLNRGIAHEQCGDTSAASRDFNRSDDERGARPA